MSVQYEYLTIKMSDLLLDDENPRFASSQLVKSKTAKISQESIITHLITYADIIRLAHRINEVKALHGSELITCYKRNDSYVVLEGNRRTCACKLLLDRELIPEKFRRNFPFISEETKSNIEEIMVIVYPDRESVQAYLSDRHINGIKKWSALEKNNFYMNLFDEYKNIKTITAYTSDSESVIKNCIRKYQFFMQVYNILKIELPNLEIEKINYLPMVDRFLDTLVGKDQEVGLNLKFNSDLLTYEFNNSKIDIYKKILKLIGEAFLIRKEKKYCTNGEIPKIISSEISNANDQKQLILNDERIRGLIKLIKEYKNESSEIINNTNSGENTSKTQNSNNKPKDYSDNKDKENKEDKEDKEDTSSDNEDDTSKYIPTKRYKPQKSRKEFLCFSYDETRNWDINGDSDYEVKIQSLIYDLSTISIYDHPYACACLYRSLLEVSTRFTYSRKIPQQNFNEKNLVGNLRYLNNNILFVNKTGKDISKIKEAIKANLETSDIVQILNLYVHYASPVDEQILLSTWNSMKFYVSACLEK